MGHVLLIRMATNILRMFMPLLAPLNTLVIQEKLTKLGKNNQQYSNTNLKHTAYLLRPLLL